MVCFGARSAQQLTSNETKTTIDARPGPALLLRAENLENKLNRRFAIEKLLTKNLASDS
jgi:hypothetical protein